MATTTTSKLVDTSVMQGVIEFDTDGNSWRFEREGRGIWKRYVKNGSAFVLDGKVSITGRATAQKLWDAS